MGELLDEVEVKPFLKWVGGKGQAVPLLAYLAPLEFDRYHEAFVGGGALFFHLAKERLVDDVRRRPRAVLSDTNQELVDCLIAVRDEVEAVIAALRPHVYDAAYYYEIRALDPRALPPAERAARMIYLNRTGFNGLYRVNRSGAFNVPFGDYAPDVLICNAPLLRACSRALRHRLIECADFVAAADRMRPGDFAYFDPPFLKAKGDSFTAYSAYDFGLVRHERLAAIFRDLSGRGVHCLLSNADLPKVRELYEGFAMVTTSRSGTVSSKPTGRGRVGELIVVSTALAAQHADRIARLARGEKVPE